MVLSGVLVSTALALVVPGATGPTARGPAATCCNAPEVLTLEASDAAVLQRVCGSRPPPVRCPALCYHSATQFGHRLASAPVQAWEVLPELPPTWVVTREILASPAPALVFSQAVSPAPVWGVLVAFWRVPVAVRAEATVSAVVPPEYGWPPGPAVCSCGWDESAVTPARARGGRPIGVCICADGMSSWQSILKTLSSPHAKAASDSHALYTTSVEAVQRLSTYGVHVGHAQLDQAAARSPPHRVLQYESGRLLPQTGQKSSHHQYVQYGRRS